MAQIKEHWQNYINGTWVDGGAGRIDVVNPATGEVLAQQALADAADVDRAVRAARDTHLSGALSGLRPVERGRMVQAMGRFLLEHINDIAPVLTLEQGKPLWEARTEIEGAARYFEYYGNQAETVEGRSIPLGAQYLDFTVHEPYGVSAQIIPWNYPLEMTARSLSAALATGNTCVIKTPELTPLTNAWFAHAAEHVGLPTGAVNILCGLGQDAGAALASHPLVNQIVFTGSVATGIAIATAAARNVVPCVLELGGKSAAIVYDDADLDAFESDARWGIFFNAGQVCSAMSRVIVHESKHDELVARLSKVAQGLNVTDGINLPEFGANMGAMVSTAQRDRAEVMVQTALSQGAQVAAGGHTLNRAGAFLQPTVLSAVRPTMDIAQQEVFGPVLSVLPFSTDQEAIEISNGTDYGLVGGVFTRDLDRATTAANQIRAGQVFVNEWYAGGVETPFGGYGKSGYGREKGREALWNYVQTKNIAIKMRG
ncbi:aldehyde dehydrogenase family protein [Thalassovita mediterranea]|jgi:aldehyde dehydrogenase (NAD+)|uniref:Putative aldehyde dehydrogenase AldA n=1 Tax=Thalassovita mediterranea TaxID=340021 RepID=A0A0P1GQF3_9RHOB|nr:aldehyde dehydrogenase family protein [Thalassovita mediterranea]CUH84842.1 Putative aldehyde dehydrogenase AldA [Thalassovita mediterranea]SIS29228.1 aldehyde dehydrogenase (NAD+) [Thalassovita mediterranea]